MTLAHAEIEAAVRKKYLRGSSADLENQIHRLLAGEELIKGDAQKVDRQTGFDILI